MNSDRVIIDLPKLEKLWSIAFPQEINRIYKNWQINCQPLSLEDFNRTVKRVLQELDSDLVKSGSHRKRDWNSGWGENLEALQSTNDLESLKPGYFEKSEILRFNQRWFFPDDKWAERDLLHLIAQTFSLMFLRPCSSIYEFGCGTGHNLLALRKVFPDKDLVGLDWAMSSQKLISELSRITGDSRICSSNFDFFNPDYSLTVSENAGFITVAALEQTGENFRDFIEFTLEKKPRLVLNIEPIGEMLDHNNLLDSLSLRYFTKRNYLNGYLSFLRDLEAKDKLRIIDTRRTYIGSLFIEGYSVCIWEPI